ncbi:hypothetical protein Lalb_Chr13g0303551 [Lupinus albus]|uniref:Uncharacterized protein n=1 Tax=Lupinus albus TaxID=3870 RepID=A0A6A4PKC4_LUPAL|nr:hypothetical protein Lalb_Chr13g0303551 [Lupinus albus]
MSENTKDKWMHGPSNNHGPFDREVCLSLPSNQLHKLQRTSPYAYSILIILLIG